MVDILLTVLVAIEALMVLYLMYKRARLKKEYRRLQNRYKETRQKLEELQFEERHTEREEPLDKLAMHDVIVEMYESGNDAETIARKLEIPENKVALTLKFEKMKRDGAQ